MHDLELIMTKIAYRLLNSLRSNQTWAYFVRSTLCVPRFEYGSGCTRVTIVYKKILKHCLIELFKDDDEWIPGMLFYHLMYQDNRT